MSHTRVHLHTCTFVCQVIFLFKGTFSEVKKLYFFLDFLKICFLITENTNQSTPAIFISKKILLKAEKHINLKNIWTFPEN
jgi:hypothetical protein